MGFTEFFIRRPVFATIINMMILVVGLLALTNVVVREYPDVAIPKLIISTDYPNASAQLIETRITDVLEDELASIPNIKVMDSSSTQGTSKIKLTFEAGHSIDNIIGDVRDAITTAVVKLPREAKQPVIKRGTEESGPPFMVISLSSDTLTLSELTHYCHLYLKNPFRSLQGVAAAEVWGQPYSMQIVLDPHKMYAAKISADNVTRALEEKNVALPAGKLQEQIPVTLNLLRTTPEEFGNLVIKDRDEEEKPINPVLLKHVASIKEQVDDKQFRIRMNGKNSVMLSIKLSSDANPLTVSSEVRKIVDQLRSSLPETIKVGVQLDGAEFIQVSLKNIYNSIFEAAALVLIVIFIFLRNFRSTIIPLITLPISLIGAIALFSLAGFSINTITLLAMVMAIGLVVDDAIVMLENIHRHIEQGLSPLEASIKGSREIGFAIIAMTLTLASVYVPIAFIQGTIGYIFTEFAVTLAGAVLISGIVALTLSPMMCSRVLKRHEKTYFPQIEKWLSQLTQSYQSLLKQVLGLEKYVCLGGLGVLVLMLGLLAYMPREVEPPEDRALLGVFIPPIPGRDINALDEYAYKIEAKIQSIPEIRSYITFMGNWGANVILPLKAWHERSRTPKDIVKEIRPFVEQFPSVDLHVWDWDTGLPGTEEVGQPTGVSLAIQTNGSYEELYHKILTFKEKIASSGQFGRISHDLLLNTPGIEIEINQLKLAKSGIKPNVVAKMIEVFLGGDRSLDYLKDTISYPIIIRGQSNPWDLGELYVSTNSGKQVSLAALAGLKYVSIPYELKHHNQMRSATLTVDLKDGQSFEKALTLLAKMKDTELPGGLRAQWVGAAQDFFESSSTMFLLLFMALIFIYAILAIQFESFVDPLIIMMTVPLACTGALILLYIVGGTLNIYSQIGLVTLIGLITKHGILLVDFANKLTAQGVKLNLAIQQAASLRLRPILMTTGAMVFGALPLVLSSGAGANSRQAIGCVLLGGLTLGTFLTLFVIPVLYLVIKQNLRMSVFRATFAKVRTRLQIE